MNISDQIQSKVKTLGLKLAEVHLHERFSSSQSDHRIFLRESIYENLSAAFSREKRPQILLLDQIPQPDEGYLSIVHCKGIGGYIYASNPIGIDIELSARISREVIDRVAQPQELNEAPFFQLLWSAKEATFKSLRGTDQPPVASEIFIESWREQYDASPEAKTYAYTAQRNENSARIDGVGLAGLAEGYTWAVFALSKA